MAHDWEWDNSSENTPFVVGGGGGGGAGMAVPGWGGIYNKTTVPWVDANVDSEDVVWSGNSEPKEREMIPKTAILTLDRDEAETQRAMFADLPKLSEREQKMMAIYDAVIAGEKVIKLKEVLRMGGAYNLEGKPKVVVAPITAEVVSFQRQATNRKRTHLSSYFQAGKWKMDLVSDRAFSAWDRASLMEAEALVPLIPPQHREGTEDTDLLLWEPVWLHSEEVVLNADPAILRPLSHGLYKVVAAWDLTAVETMMLSGE